MKLARLEAYLDVLDLHPLVRAAIKGAARLDVGDAEQRLRDEAMSICSAIVATEAAKERDAIRANERERVLAGLTAAVEDAEQRGRRQALQGFLDVWGRMTSGIWTWKAAAEAVIRWAEEERDVCDGKAARRG